VQTIEVPDHLYPALKRMVDVLASKGHDYSNGDAEWGSNFALTAEHFGMQPWEAADFNELQKLARLVALRKRGKAPENESVDDTYLDKANYALLAYALLLHHNAIAHPREFDIDKPKLTSGPAAFTGGPAWRKCCHTYEGSQHLRGCPTLAELETAAEVSRREHQRLAPRTGS
jgi:hypothetical protein